MNFFDAVKPETTITLGFIGLMLAGAVFIVVKGLFLPRSTHLREIHALERQVAQAIKDRDANVEKAREERDKQVSDIRAEMTLRMDNFRSDHAVRMEQVREDHGRQLLALVAAAEGIRADRDVMLAAKQRDADDWRAAYHIGAENAKASEDRMDEVLETERLSFNALNMLLSAIRDQDRRFPPAPQLPVGGSP